MKPDNLFDRFSPAVKTALSVTVITVLGSLVRIQYLLKTNFVLNDGGMFYSMILDLEKNNFILPRFTTYNLSQIPFTYPPLSFYIGAFFHQVMHIDLVTLLRLYPFIINITSIPAFYFFAKAITQNNRQSILSTAFYAILIPGYEWLISGGGLTRSPAHTLFILALYFYLVFLRNRKWITLAVSSLLASLMILHHLEYGWVLAISIMLFTYKKLSLRECVKFGPAYLAGVALVTSPYWVTVIAYHGISPFISAFSTGDFSIVTSFGRLLLMVFTHETLINFVNVLAIIGLLFSLFSGNYQIVIWLVLIIFLDPRSAERILVFPVALLSSFCLDQVLLPGLQRLTDNNRSGNDIAKKNSRAATIFMAFCVLYPFFLGFLTSPEEHPALAGLTEDEREAMIWVRDNTPKDSRFVVLSPAASWSVDRVAEWFPALAERLNLTTMQGTEWLPESSRKIGKDFYQELSGCQRDNKICIQKLVNTRRALFDYLLISNTNNFIEINDECLSTANKDTDNPEFRREFKNKTISIYINKN
jgi:hypothetical protein